MSFRRSKTSFRSNLKAFTGTSVDMAPIPPSPITPVEDEKTTEFDAEVGASTLPEVREGNEAEAGDADDALQLVGERAQAFDEKYFNRLRRKIVSHQHGCGCRNTKLTQ